MARQGKHRRVGTGFAQFAGRQTIVAHDDVAARCRFAPMQDARPFQRCRIRPDRVVIRCEHGKGPVGADAVQFLAGRGFVGM